MNAESTISERTTAEPPPSSPTVKPRVFLVCSGLGHVRRGFESFTQECFDALVDSPEIDLTVFAGAGPSGKKRVSLPILRRNFALARWIERFTRYDVLYLEQTTFFLELIPYLVFRKPDVIYFSEGRIGNLLWHWRRATGASFRLLFSNGGPLNPPFPRWDHIQQVNPLTLRLALEKSETVERNTLLPYGFDVRRDFTPISPKEREQVRNKLNLPTDRSLLLSVGAVNVSHKRMDYLVREVSRMQAPRPFLVLLGQQDEESIGVKNLADELLGRNHYAIRTVEPTEVGNYYLASDVFVLASLSEAFGRVFAEAMACGIPCVANDYEVSRYVLGNEGRFCDMRLEGALAETLTALRNEPVSEKDQERRHAAIYSKFSWDSVRPRYIEMLHRCAALPSLS